MFERGKLDGTGIGIDMKDLDRQHSKYGCFIKKVTRSGRKLVLRWCATNRDNPLRLVYQVQDLSERKRAEEQTAARRLSRLSHRVY